MKWVKKNKELLVVFAILLMGAFCRLYKIDEYMMFLGDEGRDVTVVRRFLKEGDLMFVGPGTSVGNMYLGPIYYYYMAPWLWAWNYSPVGPAVGVAILGVLTIWFLWYITYLWTKNKTIASGTALLYALSPVVIYYSRSSWNPNIMPFFALLLIFSLWKVWEEKKWKWLMVAGLAFAVTLQSHYLALLLFPVIVVVIIKARPPMRFALCTMCLFLLLMSPLFLFDYKHDWRNSLAIWNYFTRSDSDIKFRIGTFISHLWLVWEKLNIRLLAGTSVFFGKILAVLLPVGLILFSRRLWQITYFKLLASWLFFGLIGLALYKGEVYDHYLGFMFPLPFLLLAMLAQDIVQSAKRIGKVVLAFFFLAFFFLAFKNSPLLKYPNRLLERAIKVSTKIKEEAKGKPFNFALIADNNYEPNYQYFLEEWGVQVVEIDPQNYYHTLADQLFVVCELPREECHPTTNAKAGIANFGWSEINEEWEIEGVFLFKLKRVGFD